MNINSQWTSDKLVLVMLNMITTSLFNLSRKPGSGVPCSRGTLVLTRNVAAAMFCSCLEVLHPVVLAGGSEAKNLHSGLLASMNATKTLHYSVFESSI